MVKNNVTNLGDMIDKDSVQVEFDPYIAEKIQAMLKEKENRKRNLLNKMHKEIVRKRKQERQNRKKNRWQKKDKLYNMINK